jgi:dTDP-4-amino-4,6-dideoxygalactose transaminase
MAIPFADLKLENDSIREEINTAMQRVLDSGWYVLGNEVSAFEKEFAEFVGIRYCAGVASGTEAIQLALMAAGIGPGDEVIVPANTCMPSIVGIRSAGAQPVLADVNPESFTVSPTEIEKAVTSKSKAILPVHLYGHPCDMDPINAIAKAHDLLVVEDCAQAHGARYKGQLCGTLGDLAAFSFYPSKNLGAIGDGGAVVTQSEEYFESLTKLRNYGQTDRYTHHTIGINSRLDELQAAILRTKLKHLGEWHDLRRKWADLYTQSLSSSGLALPTEASYAEHCYHLYVIRHGERDRLKEFLSEQGIGTQIHYPIPIHQQPVWESLGLESHRYPQTEQISKEILSLPLQPLIPKENILKVIDAIQNFSQ